MTHTHGGTTDRGAAIPSFLIALFVGLGAAAPSEAQTRAYVANTNANVVTVIDTATNTQLGTIDVDGAPAHVAIAQDGKHVYVASTGLNCISVIDTSTDKVSGIIPVGGQPSSIAVTPRGDRLYVMDVNGVLQAIDTATGAVVASLTLGGTEGKIAITPDGGRVYVASGDVFVVATATNTLIKSFVPEASAIPGIGNSAASVAISPDGKHAYVPVTTYYYSDAAGFSAGGGVAVIDTVNNQVIDTIPLFSLPGSIAFTADGSRAFVGILASWAETGYGAGFLSERWVAMIDTATKSVVGWTDLGGKLGVQHTPSALAVTPDRSAVFVSIPVVDSVAAIDVATNTVTHLLVAPGPFGLAVVPDPSATPKLYSIDAIDDSPASAVPGSGAVAVANVLANDVIGRAPAAIGNVTLSLVSSSVGVTLDAGTGAVSIAAGTGVGSRSLTYRICENGNPLNCDEAVVTINVRAPFAIHAQNDSATSVSGVAAIANVVANDTLDGVPAALDRVALVVLSRDAGVTLDLATGSVAVVPGTTPGPQALVYHVCEKENLANCGEGRATVMVVPRAIHAESDTVTVPRTGGIAVTSVLANDAFDGAAATLAKVSLLALSSTTPGVTLDEGSGAVSVARGAAVGPQRLAYRICERGTDNCSEATATVVVNPYVVNAVPESARASSKTASRPIANVMANDTIGGSPANLTNAQVKFRSMSPANNKIVFNANGSVNVQDKGGSGIFILEYDLCEISTTNCAIGKVTLDLSGKN